MNSIRSKILGVAAATIVSVTTLGTGADTAEAANASVTVTVNTSCDARTNRVDTGGTLLNLQYDWNSNGIGWFGRYRVRYTNVQTNQSYYSVWTSLLANAFTAAPIRIANWLPDGTYRNVLEVQAAVAFNTVGSPITYGSTTQVYSDWTYNYDANGRMTMNPYCKV
jgi:hypothetical protein